MKNKKLIIDFDSTFVTSEGLEELGEIALRGREDKSDALAEIVRITNAGMEGRISFTESLRSRIEILQACKRDVEELSERMCEQVTPSFLRNQEWIKKNQKNIFIVSGGFHDFVDRVLIKMGVFEDHIYANQFVYDEEGKIIGFDEDNFLSKAGGKVKLLESLDLQDEVFVLGDGWTDYEMKEAGAAKQFFPFTENVERAKVVAVADQVVDSFDKIIELL